MSKIALNSNASGTGVFTIASPNSDTDRTLTLPDESGTVVSENASGNVAVTGDITSNGNAVITTQSTQLGRRNLIINGDMRINQRGFSSGTAGYTVDRWGISGASSGGVTTSGLPNNFTQAVYVTRTSAAGTGLYRQRIESNNCYYLTGENVTVSFWALDSGLSSISVKLGYASATDNFSTVTTINTNTVTSSPSGTWTKYETTFTSLPSGVTNGLEVSIQGTTASTGTLTITGVQLEVGDVATPFEHRSFGEELALCQRYFEKSFNYSVAPQNGVTHQIMYGQSGKVSFFVPKRAAPTITAYGSSITAGAQWAYYSGGVFTGANPTLYSSERMLTWFMGGYAYGDCYGNWTVDAEL